MDMNSFAFRPPGALDEGEPLQALDWAGLLARLGAERDLRREFSSRLGAANGGASFAGGAAQALDATPWAGELAVNPEGLADRKSTGGITPAAGEQTPAAGSDARGHK
jgi:hypothetical protein